MFFQHTSLLAYLAFVPFALASSVATELFSGPPKYTTTKGALVEEWRTAAGLSDATHMPAISCTGSTSCSEWMQL